MPSAMDLPVRISRSQELTKKGMLTIELSVQMCPTILCTVKCPMKRPRRYKTQYYFEIDIRYLSYILYLNNVKIRPRKTVII